MGIARVGRPPVLVMETGLNAVAGGDVPGWVSGSPANLAASGNFSAVFDLGPDWDQYSVLYLAILPQAPSSGLASVLATGSDTPSPNLNRRLQVVGATTVGSLFAASLLSANGAQGAFVRPMGRYVAVNGTNADASNALGAGAKVTLAAYPG